MKNTKNGPKQQIIDDLVQELTQKKWSKMSEADIEKLDKLTKKSRKSLSKLEAQFEEIFFNLDREDLIELTKLRPSEFLKKIYDTFFRDFSETQRIPKSQLPSCFGQLLRLFDKKSVEIVGEKHRLVFWNKVFVPLKELVQKYETVVELYCSDKLVDLFPKKYSKKTPSFDEFLKEYATDSWKRVRSSNKIRSNKDSDDVEKQKLENRSKLLDQLALILKISHKKEKSFKSDPEKFISESIDRIDKLVKAYNSVLLEDREFAMKNKPKWSEIYDFGPEFVDKSYYFGMGKSYQKNKIEAESLKRQAQTEMEDHENYPTPSGSYGELVKGWGILNACREDEEGNFWIKKIIRKDQPLVDPETAEAIEQTIEYLDSLKIAKESRLSHTEMQKQTRKQK